jgi:hypothetical protein
MKGFLNSGFFPTAVIFYTLFTFAVMTSAGTYSGGSGTAEDPYKISTAADLIELGQTDDDYSGYFILTADIDLADQTFTRSLIAADINPTGSYQGTEFTGVFDGNGHIVRNFVINQPDSHYIGFFGNIGSSGQIKNLALVDAYIYGNFYVGGLASMNSGTITSCSATGSVNGRSSVGGLVGLNYNGTITSCQVTGSVIGGSDVGGLAGYSFTGRITFCHATVAVTGLGENAGGLVGQSYSATITSCYATGSVSCTGDGVGGLVGFEAYNTVTSCYATGSVSGIDYVGGLCGRQEGTIVSCYATGKVSGSSYVGGLVGVPGYAITSSFWDIETSGMATSAGGTGLTTAQMKSSIVFTGAYWDFWTVWMMCDGVDYPHLQWEGIQCPRYSGGIGTETDPYKISTITDWQQLMHTSGDWDKSFILTTHLDFYGVHLTPVGWGSVRFTGTFNGDGHLLYNVHIYQFSESFVGLFGLLGDGGKIRNLAIRNIYIKGESNVGGLVGRSTGEITACSSTGSVTGGCDVGGLVGENTGRINSCYFSGIIDGQWCASVGGLVGINFGDVTLCYAASTVNNHRDYTGGLIGENRGSVTLSYATGTVSGEYSVGGLVGGNWGTIMSVFASGTVTGKSVVGGLVGKNFGSVSSSFWDIQTSGRTTSAGGEGKTTAQMQTLSTYTNAGWDFVGEYENGTLDNWTMPNGGYPLLSWQPRTFYLVTPNGGESYNRGSTQSITWNAEGVGNHLLLQYSMDNGSTWIDIATTPNIGSYIWYTPSSLTNMCRVKISSIEYPSFFDISETPFSIVSPQAYFADANLKAAVEAALGLTNPTEEDILKLTELTATNKGIAGLDGLEMASNLKLLNLNQNAVTDLWPLEGLTKLVVLSLDSNQITDLSMLSGLTNLSVFACSANKVTDIMPLSGLPNLGYLYINNNQISDFSPITAQTQFKEIYASRNSILTEATYLTYIPTIRANNPNLSVFQYDPGCLTFMPGDANQDCHVNLDDLAVMGSNWLKCNHIYESMCP